MKASQHYFPAGLFIRLYKVVLTFESVDKTFQIKAAEQYVHSCSAVRYT